MRHPGRVIGRRAPLQGVVGTLLATPRRAAARPAAKIRRVGVLRPASAEHVRAGRPSRGAGAQRGGAAADPGGAADPVLAPDHQTTAPALGVTIPASRLAGADEV